MKRNIITAPMKLRHIQISKYRMKASAAETFEMPAAVINKELSNELPSEYRAHFPTESSVKRSIQRERNKKCSSSPEVAK